MVLLAHPASIERGVRPIVTRRGARDAMDAGVPHDERYTANGEVVWSWRPWAGAKSVEMIHRRR
jgi:hypothetical protein